MRKAMTARQAKPTAQERPSPSVIAPPVPGLQFLPRQPDHHFLHFARKFRLHHATARKSRLREFPPPYRGPSGGARLPKQSALTYRSHVPSPALDRFVFPQSRKLQGSSG